VCLKAIRVVGMARGDKRVNILKNEVRKINRQEQILTQSIPELSVVIKMLWSCASMVATDNLWLFDHSKCG
jgi:hypothetical protein